MKKKKQYTINWRSQVDDNYLIFGWRSFLACLPARLLACLFPCLLLHKFVEKAHSRRQPISYLNDSFIRFLFCFRIEIKLNKAISVGWWRLDVSILCRKYICIIHLQYYLAFYQFTYHIVNDKPKWSPYVSIILNEFSEIPDAKSKTRHTIWNSKNAMFNVQVSFEI